MKHIAVLITCFNRREKTIACLSALYATTIPEGIFFEVYLVNDGSSDGTEQAVCKLFPAVNVIQGNGNLYWNRGMYLAWETAREHADFDFYLWLNDDVKITKTCIIDLIKDSDQHPKSIICGTLKSAFSNLITYGGRNGKGKLLLPSGTCRPCSFINGNVVLVPKKIYDKVGMLDPVFPHAIGDFDYGKRVEAKGFNNVISAKYIGFCESNFLLPIWCRTEEHFFSRIKSLYSPLGNSHPYYYFIYTWRHFDGYVSFKHWMSIHLRVLIPSLWKQQ